MALAISIEDTRPFWGSKNLDEVKLNHRMKSDLCGRISGFSHFSLMFGRKPKLFYGSMCKFWQRWWIVAANMRTTFAGHSFMTFSEILHSNETGIIINFSGNYSKLWQGCNLMRTICKVLRYCLLFWFTLIAKPTEVLLFVCPFVQLPTPFTWLLYLPQWLLFWVSFHFSVFTEHC